MGHDPHVWSPGETIAADKLNNIEQAVAAAAVVSDIGVAGTATDTALRVASGTYTGARTWTGAQTFQGPVALSGGGATLRQPVNGSVVIDGNTARALPGDKVAYSFAATIKGGFSGDGGGNPTFAWGANDFFVTGAASGDVAGVNNLTARETEVHLYTPGASLINMKGLQLDCVVEASATSATVGSMFGLYVSTVGKNAASATVTNAYGAYIEAPTAATNNYGLYVNGASTFVGNVSLIGTSNLTVAGGLTAGSGTSFARFIANTPNAQGAAAGAYLGNFQGAALELSDGTNNIRLDNDGSGTLRVLRAGVSVSLTLDLSGNLTLAGGLAFTPATTATAPTAGGAGALPATPAGYMTVTVGGTARKVAYY